MLFEPIDFSKLNEQDVREEILAPIIRHLGYRRGTSNDVIRELSLRYPRIFLGRKKPKKDPIIRGEADYVLDIDNKWRWVLEAKSPGQIDIDEIEQAYSYAIHPEVRAIYFCLSDGYEFKIYRTDYAPDVAPIFQTNYDELNTTFATLKNILSPESIKRNWSARVIDIGKPVGTGLNSLVKIESGHIGFQSNSWNIPVYNALSLTVVNGTIQRDEDGKLLIYLVTRSSLALQEKNSRLGLDTVEVKSSEDILSCDSEKPTLFVSRKTYTIPQGETALNITTGKTTLLPYTVKADISINARAVLSAKKLSGQFTCEYNFHQSTSSLSLVGEFELNLS
jgi:hypothetical protein